MSIPQDLVAKILFKSDRTCCVCREKGKSVQIHHIDGDNTNNNVNNLAVLCFDCHTETQIKGEFHRKLNPELITLYKNDWDNIVGRNRIDNIIRDYKEESNESLKIRILTHWIEVLKENGEYVLLASLYNNIGNNELRDKYVEIALKESMSPQTLIFLRSMQKKMSTVPKEIIEEEVEKKIKNKDWSQLARIYVNVDNTEKAVENYCKSILEDIEEGNIFSAAFYLKEMCISEKLHDKLFEMAYKKAIDENDIWWQIRSLQELGWKSELEELLKKNKKIIEESNDPMMLTLLYKTLNNEKLYIKSIKQLYSRKRYVEKEKI